MSPDQDCPSRPLPVSQFFPSGRDLVTLLQNVVDDLQRLTETLVSLQQEMDIDGESQAVLDSVRETRWTCALIWKEFQVMTDLGASIAEATLSIPDARSRSTLLHARVHIERKAIRLRQATRFQQDRLRSLRLVWNGSVTDDFTAPRIPPRVKPPPPKRFSFFLDLLGQKAEIKVPPEPRALPDLHHYLPSVGDDIGLLEEHWKAVVKFWKGWGRAPQGVELRASDFILADREWLEQEWDVGLDLRVLSGFVRGLSTKLCDEAPPLLYPVT